MIALTAFICATVSAKHNIEVFLGELNRSYASKEQELASFRERAAQLGSRFASLRETTQQAAELAASERVRDNMEREQYQQAASAARSAAGGAQADAAKVTAASSALVRAQEVMAEKSAVLEAAVAKQRVLDAQLENSKELAAEAKRQAEDSQAQAQAASASGAADAATRQQIANADASEAHSEAGNVAAAAEAAAAASVAVNRARADVVAAEQAVAAAEAELSSARKDAERAANAAAHAAAMASRKKADAAAAEVRLRDATNAAAARQQEATAAAAALRLKEEALSEAAQQVDALAELVQRVRSLLELLAAGDADAEATAADQFAQLRAEASTLLGNDVLADIDLSSPATSVADPVHLQGTQQAAAPPRTEATLQSPGAPEAALVEPQQDVSTGIAADVSQLQHALDVKSVGDAAGPMQAASSGDSAAIEEQDVAIATIVGSATFSSSASSSSGCVSSSPFASLHDSCSRVSQPTQAAGKSSVGRGPTHSAQLARWLEEACSAAGLARQAMPNAATLRWLADIAFSALYLAAFFAGISLLAACIGRNLPLAAIKVTTTSSTSSGP